MALRKGQGWTPIYLLIVLIIAAVLIITLIKPLFRQAAISAEENVGEAGSVAKSASLLVKFFF
jgi:competence protein ComGC